MDPMYYEDLRGRLFGLLILLEDRMEKQDAALIHQFIAADEYGLALEELVSCERGSFTWAAFREYLVGGLGPGEGVAAVVPAVDEGLDRGDEVLDRGEAAAADGLPGDDAEENLDHVQPRPGRRREVQGNPGVF